MAQQGLRVGGEGGGYRMGSAMSNGTRWGCNSRPPIAAGVVGVVIGGRDRY